MESKNGKPAVEVEIEMGEEGQGHCGEHRGEGEHGKKKITKRMQIRQGPSGMWIFDSQAEKHHASPRIVAVPKGETPKALRFTMPAGPKGEAPKALRFGMPAAPATPKPAAARDRLPLLKSLLKAEQAKAQGLLRSGEYAAASRSANHAARLDKSIRELERKAAAEKKEHAQARAKRLKTRVYSVAGTTAGRVTTTVAPMSGGAEKRLAKLEKRIDRIEQMIKQLLARKRDR